MLTCEFAGTVTSFDSPTETSAAVTEVLPGSEPFASKAYQGATVALAVLELLSSPT